MKVSEFVSKAKYIADNLATTYALGTWGWAGMDKMKTRAINKNQTNKNLANKIKALPASGFMFDCGGIIKGIICSSCAISPFGIKLVKILYLP